MPRRRAPLTAEEDPMTTPTPTDPAAPAPRADRPVLPQGYGVPADPAGMLPWSWAEALLSAAINYWVGTTRPNGRPHAVPIWGVWLDTAFWFEGGPTTRRGRNLAA